MSEHQPPAAEPGGTPAEADEAELIRKVLRAQERHREGGIDPELDGDAPGRSQAGEAGGAGQGEHHGG